ncbi:hypothetical protein [Actinokineospora globicatena]|uniref:hypothetical protein n=1 Tax=Actinokineospora globicatena TaxID=103729 RepID=UPI0020A374B9|nr:hypothetical protein [Actinokineospora globicatena]MCP2301396.1 hypothetical protein [Actinokineospora globicatena]GLW76965.1 hypothetical protein Aglo01_14470 [Actinokineospora globicatena]GLW83798.1 hypothetical protein Aglo02_14380 [Actinokineospora globicatena]
MVMPNVESSLRRERGVRRPDLRQVIDPDLARRMHIAPNADRPLLLATVAWQLDWLIKRTFDQKRDRLLLSAAYNIERDPRLTALSLSQRITVVSERRGWSASRLTSLLSELVRERMRFALDGPYPVPDLAVVREQASIEATYDPRRASTRLALSVVPSADLTSLLTGSGWRELAVLALRGGVAIRD